MVGAALDQHIACTQQCLVLVHDGDHFARQHQREVHLKPGDVIVQQATNHAWVNRGTAPCRIAFVLMDSREP